MVKNVSSLLLTYEDSCSILENNSHCSVGGAVKSVEFHVVSLAVPTRNIVTNSCVCA